jgi:hypothetical protein
MKKDVTQSKFFALNFFAANSIEELWHCNIKNIKVRNIEAKYQNLKRISDVKAEL